MPSLIEIIRAFQRKFQFFKSLNPEYTSKHLNDYFNRFIYSKFLALQRGHKFKQRKVEGGDLLTDLNPQNPPAPSTLLQLLATPRPNIQTPGSSILERITKLGTPTKRGSDTIDRSKSPKSKLNKLNKKRESRQTTMEFWSKKAKSSSSSSGSASTDNTTVVNNQPSQLTTNVTTETSTSTEEDSPNL
jgi:hypothetical protein